MYYVDYIKLLKPANFFIGVKKLYTKQPSFLQY